MTGEERVDEAELRRDDDLGNLVSKAFDSRTAAAALPPLGIGGKAKESDAETLLGERVEKDCQDARAICPSGS